MAASDSVSATLAAGVTLIPSADLVASPWKNGGGVTREIAAYVPQKPDGTTALDAFVWRVSVADVAQAGPFSRFPGIDRTLVLLSGAGMWLDEPSTDDTQPTKTHALNQPLDIARFTGEASIDARLADGATRDFNLMVRRDAAHGEMDVWRGARQCTLTADAVLLYCANGPAFVRLGDAQAVQMQTGDTLRIDAPKGLQCEVEGSANTDAPGALLAITLRYTPRSTPRSTSR
ncbi:HutD family protein [Paraburkholderia sp. BCC1886]|uniref:HutD/Ves family protein n=1 Tax=Paraburkholderia sp. BCC1886 TaxID=2562670 RepID=UPI001183A344|nr:HutD family protein [Paraburkholderia sp. BCC1886]